MFSRALLFLLICFNLTPLHSSQPLDKVVALVNNDVITETELNVQVQTLKKQIQAQEMAVPTEQVLRKQVLQHLIDTNLQIQLAKNNNISIDDVELNKAIKRIANGNKLTVSQLRKKITSEGMSWKSFRNNIRKELTMRQVQQKAVSQEINVSEDQVRQYLKVASKEKANQKIYHLKNIVISLPEEPTTRQLKQAREKAEMLLSKIKKGANFSRIAIEESSDQYALKGGDLGKRHLAELPEVFAKEVINMKEGEVKGPIRTGNGYQLIKLVTADGASNKKHYITKTHVRHILIKPTTSTTPKEAKKQVYNLYQQLKTGNSFAKMAKRYSLDATSSVKGGDLGWVKSGDLVPEFETSMNKLPIKQISKPVKTKYGWHIIQVLGRKKVDDSLAFEKQKIRQYLQQRKFAEAVQNWVQRLRADAFVKVYDKSIA